jgi:hypothetical protein
MSQVMYYWKWPMSGVGTASSTYTYRSTTSVLTTPLAVDPSLPTWWTKIGWSAGNLWMTGGWDDVLLQQVLTMVQNSSFQSAVKKLYYSMPTSQTTLSADFGNTTYQWNLVRDLATAADAGGLEAAKISYHAGVAVKMDYGLTDDAAAGSGAYDSDIPGALTGHFRYDGSARFNDSADPDAMVNEIQWQRPVLIGGDGTRGGHCWVIYGYNQLTSPWQFAMNMGWNDGSDGWYSLDNVPLGFTQNQDTITRIAPANAVRFVGAGGSGNGSPASPYQNVEEAIIKASDNATLIFKTKSLNTFSTSSLRINRPLTLRGIQVTISK